jgi:hypothetical protein
MATSYCFNGFWRLTRLSPTTTAESEHDVDVAVIALYRHWRGAELTRPARMRCLLYLRGRVLTQVEEENAHRGQLFNDQFQ